jgi:predicted MPP superfamily phosphohydrolase
MAKRHKRSGALGAFFAFLLSVALLSAIPYVVFALGPGKGLKDKNEIVAEKLKKLTGDRFVFIAMGDTESGLFFNEPSTLKIIKNINREGRFEKVAIDCVFVSGDDTFRGTRSHYKAYVKLISLLKFAVISVVGNHDFDNGGKKYFQMYLGAPELAFGSRNSYFIVLNNEEGDLSEAQFAWLERELRNGMNYAHRFVFMHKPPFNPYQQSWYRIETTPWPSRFMRLCEDYKVDIVFSGHEHMFKEGYFNGVRYIVTGGGGMLPTIPSWEGGYLHYVCVSVNGKYASYEVRRVPPPLWLYLSYYLWKDLFYIVKGFVI